ncbi:MAG: hypothetical protein ACREJX_01855, partial [Polyangiaceae bacterium]
YYLPLAEWLSGLLEANAKRPYFLGISGPQGSGKSTIADALTNAFSVLGKKTTHVSVDDFYLTRDEQVALSEKHPHDPLFEVRGFAGTHDVDLGARVLGALSRGAPVRIPKYDKSAHGGLGDRAPESEWRDVEELQDLVIFEGWMLGFHKLPKHALDEDLWPSNELLPPYGTWTQKLDAFLLLEAKELDFIVKWRVDSERARREKGEQTMNEVDAQKYVERFLPVYAAYVPRLRDDPPTENFKRIVLDANREPIALP